MSKLVTPLSYCGNFHTLQILIPSLNNKQLSPGLAGPQENLGLTEGQDAELGHESAHVAATRNRIPAAPIFQLRPSKYGVDCVENPFDEH